MMGRFNTPSMPSMPSLSIPTMNMKKMDLSQLTKKMGNINMPSIPVLSANDDKKARLAEEKRNQISTVLSILEDVKLQCPPTHTGLIVAFAGSTSSPILNPGIKFTWYRMSADDKVELLEVSLKAWYPPTVDDIGCKICAQCEDNFSQGCSRYLECGPIKADSILCSLSETIVESNCYEAKGVSVSLGIYETKRSQSLNFDLSSNSGDNQQFLNNIEPLSALDQDLTFLQLNGKSSVEVDENGVFISIPSSNVGKGGGSYRNAANKFKTSRRGLRIPPSEHISVKCVQPLAVIMVVPITRKGIAIGTDSTESSAPLTPITHSASGKEASADNPNIIDELTTKLSVQEGVVDEMVDESNVKEVQPVTEKDGNEVVDEEKMKKFLTSSIVAIPWTYVGVHSPEAYATDTSQLLTPEERSQMMREAEEDAIIFASTVCSLAEFISSLPEGSEELRICFTCSDRLSRDALALSIRSLVSQPAGSTRYERTKVFPWIVSNGQGSRDSSLIADSTEDNEMDLRKRLRDLEDEATNLKRERNELTIQLLEQREEAVLLKVKLAAHASGSQQNLSAISENQLSSRASFVVRGVEYTQPETNEEGSGASVNNVDGLVINTEIVSVIEASNTVDTPSNPSLSGTQDEQSSKITNEHADAYHTSNEKSSPIPVSAVETSVDSNQLAIGNLDYSNYISLSSKVIELENKLNIAAKKEADALKSRTDVEYRNSKLMQENERLQSVNSEMISKLSTLQTMYDRQSTSIKHLEDQLQENVNQIEQLRMKSKEWERKASTATDLEQQIQELNKQLDGIHQALEGEKKSNSSLQSDVKELEEKQSESEKQFKIIQSQLEKQLTDALVENKRMERETAILRDKIAQQVKAIEEAKALKLELNEANNKNAQLSGEINHLQKKADSLSRDLKKTMREDAMAIAEFEKALIRKSEECNDLQHKLNEMKDDELSRADSTTTGVSLFGRSLTRNPASLGSGSSSNHGYAGNNNVLSPSTATTAAGISGMFRKFRTGSTSGNNDEMGPSGVNSNHGSSSNGSDSGG